MARFSAVPAACLAGLCISSVLAGCSGKASARSQPTEPRPSATTLGSVAVRVTSALPATPPIRRPPPSATTAAIPPPLPVPAPITPLVAPRLPGEGIWQPSPSAKLARGYAVYTTQLRPGAGYPEAGIAWINSAATRLALYAGTDQPVGTWPEQDPITAPDLPTLLAAFNGGFKLYSSYSTGWYEQGRTAVPLQTGAASFVIYSNGTATVADWGRDARLGSTVVAVRQNLTLLVDHSRPAADVGSPSEWGAVLGGGTLTWRSGVGVTAAGDLVYVGGPTLTPASLAGLLLAAGAVRAMELDINPSWVSFATFAHAAGGAIVYDANLLSGMHHSPNHYLAPYARDFFAVFAR